MMIEVEFVENTIEEGMDEINYIYALCECLVIPQGLRIRRPNKTGFIKFYCPRCGEPLRIYARGRYEG